jgi:hypothetical protein
MFNRLAISFSVLAILFMNTNARAEGPAPARVAVSMWTEAGDPIAIPAEPQSNPVQVTGVVHISVTAAEPNVPGQVQAGLRDVNLKLDGAQLGATFAASGNGPSTFLFDWNTAGLSGPHNLSAIACDIANNCNTATLPCVVLAPDTTPPTIQFVTPSAGMIVSGKIQVAGFASDPAGVKSMQLLVQGSQAARSSSGSISATVNTNPYKGQTIALVLIASDTFGNAGKKQISVGVRK